MADGRTEVKAPMETLHPTEALQKLRADAEDCELIGNLATDPAKRVVFANLARQLRLAAADMEQAIARKAAAPARPEVASLR
jgi:hypothetical protein